MERLPVGPGIFFRHGPFLGEVSDELTKAAGLAQYDERLREPVGAEYARRLKETVDRELTATTSETHARDPHEVGGPGIEFDLVVLGLQATAVAGAYVVWKEVAADLRRGVELLRRLSNDHVIISEPSAVVAAVDAIAEPGTFADLTLRFVAAIRHPDVDRPRRQRGYFVGLEQDGNLIVLAVNNDGEVVGRADLEGIDAGLLGL